MKTKNVNPLLKNRVTSDHRESLFELAAVGIGGTIEMECARMKKEERLRQVRVRTMYVRSNTVLDIWYYRLCPIFRLYRKVFLRRSWNAM